MSTATATAGVLLPGTASAVSSLVPSQALPGRFHAECFDGKRRVLIKLHAADGNEIVLVGLSHAQEASKRCTGNDPSKLISKAGTTCTHSRRECYSCSTRLF